MAVETGRTAPYFSLTSAGSGRRVSLRSCAGRPLVLIFHGQANAGTVRDVNREIRLRYPRPEDLTVASVIDLSFVPPVYWMVASMELDRAYREAARELPDDVDPRDYLHILPDWAGSTTRKYGARGAGENVVVVVVDGESKVTLHYAGDDPVGAAIRTLEDQTHPA